MWGDGHYSELPVGRSKILLGTDLLADYTLGMKLKSYMWCLKS